MVNLLCRGGPLNGKMMVQPSHVYEFEVTNGVVTEKYIRYTEADGYGNYFSEWRLKNKTNSEVKWYEY